MAGAGSRDSTHRHPVSGAAWLCGGLKSGPGGKGTRPSQNWSPLCLNCRVTTPHWGHAFPSIQAPRRPGGSRQVTVPVAPGPGPRGRGMASGYHLPFPTLGFLLLAAPHFLEPSPGHTDCSLCPGLKCPSLGVDMAWAMRRTAGHSKRSRTPCELWRDTVGWPGRVAAQGHGTGTQDMCSPPG